MWKGNKNKDTTLPPTTWCCEKLPSTEKNQLGFYGLTIWAIPEEIQTVGGLRINFSEKILTIFRFVTLPLKNKLSPMEILKNCVTPPGNSKVKK